MLAACFGFKQHRPHILAFFDLLIGYLIFKSTFLPRILGVMIKQWSANLCRS
jgi:hypothetical protein